MKKLILVAVTLSAFTFSLSAGKVPEQFRPKPVQRVPNPMCVPKINQLKADIKQNKQLKKEAKGKEEKSPLIHTLYDLHRQLAQTRKECYFFSKNPYDENEMVKGEDAE